MNQNLIKSNNKTLNISMWNIHGAASWDNDYCLQPGIVDKFFSSDPDILILTEFVLGEGFDYLFQSLRTHGYLPFHYTRSLSNGILIAAKKNKIADFQNFKKKAYHDEEILTTQMMADNNLDQPDFLQVKIPFREIGDVFIVGTRIRPISKNSKAEQIKVLASHLENLKQSKNADKIIVAGDFNMFPSFLQKMLPESLTVSSPFLVKEGQLASGSEHFSYILPNGRRTPLDHIITFNNISVQNLSYDFSFLDDNPNLYKNKSKYSPLFYLKGLPDHAILSANLFIA